MAAIAARAFPARYAVRLSVTTWTDGVRLLSALISAAVKNFRLPQ
ncbi:MAG: hypothetical protein V3S18_05930 [Dehalococcoidia bacterium]